MDNLIGDINIEQVLHKLLHYNPSIYTCMPECTIIRSAKLLADGLSQFEPDCLYIGKASVLEKIIVSNPCANFLCVPDILISTQIIQKSNINLIMLDEDCDIFSLFNEVQDILNICINFIRSSKKLMDALLKGKGIQHIIDTAYGIIGNPIAFGDPSGRLIAQAKLQESIEPIWDEHLRYGKFSDSTINSREFKSSLERINKSDSPVHIRTYKYSKIAGKVKIDDKTIGYLTVIEFGKLFTEGDIDLVSLLCDVISCEIQKRQTFRNSQRTMYDEFIVELLNGKITDSKTVNERVKALNIKLHENFFIMTIDTRKSDVVHDYTIHLLFRLEEIISCSKSFLYNNYIVLFINSSKRKPEYNPGIKSFTEFLKNNSLYAGLSWSFHNLLDMSHYYKQSLKALELGLKNSREDIFFLYENYMIYHLGDIQSDTSNILKDFCHPSFLSLVEYDNRNMAIMSKLFTHIYCARETKLNRRKLWISIGLH